MSTEQRYDAIIIGGGHNGLVTAAYLARAGMRSSSSSAARCWAAPPSPRRSSPASGSASRRYVVSLLRPEIIRDLDLGRHGLQILPLDGTFTPLDDDYLWRVNDHGTTFRELRRWSLSDAEAYEEYGRLMVHMARFIKPILSVVPPDQGRIHPREWMLAGPAGAQLRRAAATPARHLHPGDDDERRRLPRPVVRDRSAEGDDVRVRHHRHVPGRSLAGHRVRAAAPLHGRDRRRVPRLGHPQGRHRRRQPRHRLGGRVAGRGDPHRGLRRQDRHRGRPGRRGHAGVRRGAAGRRRAVSAPTRGSPSSGCWSRACSTTSS